MSARTPPTDEQKKAAGIESVKKWLGGQKGTPEAIGRVANLDTYLKKDNRGNYSLDNSKIGNLRRAYISEGLGLDAEVFKKGGYNFTTANQGAVVRSQGLDYTNSILLGSNYAKANVDHAIKYKQLGVTDLTKIFDKNKPSGVKAQEAVIRDVYGLDPNSYKVTSSTKVQQVVNGKKVFKDGKPVYVNVPNNTYAIDQARADYDYNQPKISQASGRPANFIEAAQRYQAAVDQAIRAGVDTLNDTDRATLREAGRQVRLYKSEATGASAQNLLDTIKGAEDALNALDTARAREKQSEDNLSKASRSEQKRYKELLDIDRRGLLDLTMQIRQGAPRIFEAAQGLNFNDVNIGSLGAAAALGSGSPSPALGDAANLTTGATTATGGGAAGTPSGLAGTVSNLSANNLFGTATPVGKDAPANEVDNAILAEYNRVNDRAISDSNSAIAAANTRLADLRAKQAYAQPGDANFIAIQKQINEVTTDLASLNDTLTKANALKTKGFTVTENDRTQYRKIISLPEQNALDQINLIDPNYLSTSRSLQGAYKSMIDTPLGATQDERTEAMRGMIEDEAPNQLRLGSTLDESVRRDVEQAARGAQTARGNIFGVAPAVEEAMQTGLLGEQRKAQRYGAAASFLGSGMSRGDQAARDTALRQSLNLSRLGAANEFLAGGANPYNIANQYVANKNAAFNNYIAANVGQAGGFNTASYATNPFQFVNPNAGLEGAQTSASIYNTMQNAAASMYGSQVGAISRSYTSPSQAFGNIASGLGSMFSFGGTIPIGCWVAREVYGEENPKWMQFRSWLLEKAPRWLVDAYCKFGPAVAKFISNKPWIKAIIRKWMDGRIKSYGYV